jgi:uncharacterized protein
VFFTRGNPVGCPAERLITHPILTDNDFPGKRNSMHLIVDGYNLIRQSDTLRGYERISLEAGRQALVRSLGDYRKLRGHKITIVFDGWVGGSPLEERDRAGGIDIIYSRLGEKADEVIKRLLAKGSEEIMVVTSDREIVNFAARRGKTSIASDAFASLLDDLSAEHASQGPRETEEDEEDEDRRAAAKKKGPARRLSKQKRAALARIKKL